MNATPGQLNSRNKDELLKIKQGLLAEQADLQKAIVAKRKEHDAVKEKLAILKGEALEKTKIDSKPSEPVPPKSPAISADEIRRKELREEIEKKLDKEKNKKFWRRVAWGAAILLTTFGVYKIYENNKGEEEIKKEAPIPEKEKPAPTIEETTPVKIDTPTMTGPETAPEELKDTATEAPKERAVQDNSWRHLPDTAREEKGGYGPPEEDPYKDNTERVQEIVLSQKNSAFSQMVNKGTPAEKTVEKKVIEETKNNLKEDEVMFKDSTVHHLSYKVWESIKDNPVKIFMDMDINTVEPEFKDFLTELQNLRNSTMTRPGETLGTYFDRASKNQK